MARTTNARMRLYHSLRNGFVWEITVEDQQLLITVADTPAEASAWCRLMAKTFGATALELDVDTPDGFLQ